MDTVFRHSRARKILDVDLSDSTIHTNGKLQRLNTSNFTTIVNHKDKRVHHPSRQLISGANTIRTVNMGLMESLRNKVELYRLEQRYTKREKRTTFISHAQYVDGEYIYAGSPTSAKSSSSFGSGWSGKGPSVRVKEVFRQSRVF